MSVSPLSQPRSDPRGDYLEEPGKGHPLWWSYISLAVRTVCQIGSSMILARLLLPSDYGVVSMLGTLLAVLTVLGEMGLNWVAIQRARLSLFDVHTFFFFNVVFGFVCALCCAAMGPILAWFFHEPALVWCARYAALSYPLAAVAVQPLALMRRNLLFRDVCLVEGGSVAGGAVAGIGLALYWRDYRALIIQVIVTQGLRALLALSKSGYRPARPDSIRAGFRELGAGGWLQLFQLFTQIFRNFDNFILGAYTGARETGFYARAYFLTTLPSQLTVGTLNESVVPHLAQASSRGQNFGSIFRRYVRFAAATSMPLAAYMACSAHELILFFYGPKWAGVDRLLALMSLTMAFQPIYNSSYWLLLATGRFRLMAYIGGANCLVMLGGILAGVKGGASGVAEAYGSVMVALTVATMVWAHRAVGLALIPTLRVLQWPTAVSVTIALSLLAVRGGAIDASSSPFVSLIALSATAAAAFVGCITISLARTGMLRVRSLRSAEFDELILEIRRLFGDERNPGRREVG